MKNSRSYQGVSRRTFLAGSALAPLFVGGCTSVKGLLAEDYKHGDSSVLSQQSSWAPYPNIENLVIHNIPVEGATLWCTDTGGDGIPLVLLHAHTGSALNWGYQQQFFSKKGFRVIAYSRRGYYGTVMADSENPLLSAPASADLNSVVQALGLDKFHLVGTAAGGMIVPDYALSYPDQLLSITIACSLAGISDEDYVKGTNRLLPPEFHKLPPEYKELSASYILANPEGVERWKELERLSKPNTEVFDFSLFRKTASKVRSSELRNIKIPTLILTGDTDPYFPQFRARKVANMFPNSRYVLIPESSHSPYWEQYKLFNKALLEFFTWAA
jgi:pimeloyl-ACP methyl ester carboxylesterase